MFALIALSCCFVMPAAAHRLYSVDIKVQLLDNGDGLITETRRAKIGQNGTEGYIAQYNLRKGMGITDLHVSDETGAEYEVEDRWDIDRTREQKTHKCGYHMTDEGVELCWGMGTAGMRTYYIRYRVVGLLMGYNESDGFNHCFFSTNDDGADSVRLHVFKEGTPFVAHNPNVWMFGCNGMINVEGGTVEAYNTHWIYGSQKMIVMMEFPKGVFTPHTIIDGDFDTQVKQIALSGSDYEQVSIENNPSLFAHIKRNTEQWLFALGGFFSLILTMLLGKASVDTKRKEKQLLTNLFGEKKNILWHRDIPVDGNLLRARAIFNTVGDRTLKPEDAIAAYTLRLMLKKKIEIRRRTDSDNTYVDLLLVNDPVRETLPKNASADERMEHLIHRLFLDAAGDDHLLEPKEIRAYFQKNPVDYRTQVSSIDRILKSNAKVPLETIGKDEANGVLGLEKFLREFTLLSERGTMEAALWKDYMTFATLFGIAKRVAKELRGMLPEMPLSDVELYNSISDTPLYYYAASSLNSSMQHVRVYKTPEEIQREREERSSGGGGSSSFGGGGGFSGGGGSGFR